MSNEKTRAAREWLTETRKLKLTPKVLEETFTELLADYAEQAVAHLEGERDRYKKALEHYAQKPNWCPLLGEIRPDERIVYNGFDEQNRLYKNGYHIAQAALRGEE